MVDQVSVGSLLENELGARPLQEACVVEPADSASEMLCATSDYSAKLIRANEAMTLDEFEDTNIALCDAESR